MGALATPLKAEVSRPAEKVRGAGVNYPIALALITLLAAALRLHAIGAKSFWFDETLSAGLAGLSWPQLLTAFWQHELNMSPYVALLHVWVHLGTTPAIIRGLPALFSVASVPILYALGARLFSRRVGLLVRNVQDPASARWDLYAVICALFLYSHILAALLLVAHAVSVVALPGKHIPWRGLLRSYFLLALMLVPLVIFTLKTGAEPVIWIPRTTAKLLLKAGFDFSGNYGPLLFALMVLAVGLATSLWLRTWHSQGRSMGMWTYALLFCWLIVPAILLAAASLRQPLFVPRYIAYCVPPLLLLAAVGMDSLQPRALTWVLCAAISVCSVLGTLSYYRSDFDVDRSDWPGATSFIFDHAQPGDSLFFLNWGVMPFEYYRSQRTPLAVWPKNLNSATGSGLTADDYIHPTLGEAFLQASPAGDRVWVVMVYYRDPDADVVRAVYGNGRHLVAQRDFAGIRVLLFSRDADPTAQIPQTQLSETP